ncbi:MAG: S-layer homology domain-containing protein [Oscillospiraceae bacterium]|nr:S-layer homology domain-containing protein [Oscillospiraceae bacterium]
MKKQSKKAFAAIISAVMALSALPAAPTAVYADSDSTAKADSAETQALKKAISDVKKRINIPKTMDKFDYDTKTSYENTFFRLRWYSEEDNGSYTYTAQEIIVEYYNGFISSYRYNDHTDNSSSKRGFAKLSSEEQFKFAENHIYVLNPDLKGDLVLSRNTSDISLSGKTVSYSISRTANNIPVAEGNHGSITIDRNTGKLISFSLKWWNDAKFPSSKKILSVEEVSEIYASRKGLYAYYDLFTKYWYDEETDQYMSEDYILPVYAPEYSGENEIDAITGKYTSLYDDKKKYSYTDAYTWGNYYDYDAEYEEEILEEGAVDDEAYFNEAELAALEKENNYISAEKALKIIKDNKYIVYNDELIFKSKNLRTYTDTKGEQKEALTFSYRFTSSDKTKDSIYLDVTMDALTGEIISFSKTYDYGDKSKNRNTTKVQTSKAKKTAGEAAKYFIGKKADEYKVTVTSDSGFYTDKKYTATTQYFTYTRYVNDLEAPFDKMHITVDSKGEVLEFSYDYHDMEFPEPKLVGEKKAYEMLFENMKPELYYTGFTDLQLKSHTYLTYEFDSNYYINALTGERITYSGEPYYINYEPEAEKTIAYSDIKGHKYEKEIQTLLDYGVYMTDSDKLNPDEAVTVGEFVELCDRAYGIYLSSIYPEKSVYDEKEKKYIYTPHPLMETELTNAELAKIFVHYYTSYEDAAVLKDIYKSPYSDVKESHEYVGYIAIAKAKGLIADDGKFSPEKTITKADCLKIAYDYLSQDNDKKLYEIYKI